MKRERERDMLEIMRNRCRFTDFVKLTQCGDLVAQKPRGREVEETEGGGEREGGGETEGGREIRL